MVADPPATANGTRAATPDDTASGPGLWRWGRRRTWAHLARGLLSDRGAACSRRGVVSMSRKRARGRLRSSTRRPAKAAEHPPSSARIPPDPADEVAGWFDPVEDGPSGTDLDDWPDHFGAARLGVPW